MIKRSLELFLKYIGIVELSLLSALIVTLPLNFIGIKDVGKDWVYSVVMFLIIAAGVFLLSYREGYSDRQYEKKKDLISLTIVFVLQIIIGLPFKYAMYTSGPAFFLGSLVKWYTTHTTLDTIGDAPLWMHVVPLIICDLILIPVWFSGKKAGREKREKDRQSLTKERT